MFYGRSFIYNSIPSETYGLYIMSIDSNGINESMGSSSMEVYERKIYRRAKPYFYGSTPSPKLSFAFSAFSEDEIDAGMFQLIQKWLFSSRQYKRLQIDQDDIRDIYFNCFLNDPKIVRVGNKIMGFNCTVVCDSPYAWKFPKTTTYSYTQSVVNSTETYFNGSDDSGAYLYPIIRLTMNNIVENDVSITNLDDNNRVFSFSDLSPNEVITVDNSLQTITSSTGQKRMTKFNKNFLRLVPGRNRLRIQGNPKTVEMTCQWVAKKISG